MAAKLVALEPLAMIQRDLRDGASDLEYALQLSEDFSGEYVMRVRGFGAERLAELAGPNPLTREAAEAARNRLRPTMSRDVKVEAALNAAIDAYQPAAPVAGPTEPASRVGKVVQALTHLRK